MLRTYILLLCAVVAWAAECDITQPVGLELGAAGPIPDSSMTTNSKINDRHGPQQGRLNNYKGKPGATAGVGAWCANKTDDQTFRYLQIDLGMVRKIRGIATQGRNTTSNQYVKSYHISYSTLGQSYPGILAGTSPKLFTGNTDKNTIVYQDIPFVSLKPLEARYIRILPQEFYANMCMRVEIYECVEPTTQPPTTPTSPPTCPVGYHLAADNKTCEDVDECQLYTHNCFQICHNTNGSFHCSCYSGFILQGDGRTCEDVDECQLNTHNCVQNCHNIYGTFYCGCYSGFILQGDGRTCEDVDECGLNTHSCEQICHNTNGSFHCSCFPGFILQGDGRTCEGL